MIEVAEQERHVHQWRLLGIRRHVRRSDNRVVNGNALTHEVEVVLFKPQFGIAMKDELDRLAIACSGEFLELQQGLVEGMLIVELRGAMELNVGGVCRNAKPTRKHGPAAEVAISTKARTASELEGAHQPPDAQIDQLAGEFVRRFFESEGPAEQEGGNGEEASNTTTGRTAFVRLLESYGFTIQEDEHGADKAIVSQKTGDVVIRLTAETKDKAKKELLTLTRDILSSML